MNPERELAESVSHLTHAVRELTQLLCEQAHKQSDHKPASSQELADVYHKLSNQITALGEHLEKLISGKKGVRFEWTIGPVRNKK